METKFERSKFMYQLSELKKLGLCRIYDKISFEIIFTGMSNNI